jgi:glycolate oxidase
MTADDLTAKTTAFKALEMIVGKNYASCDLEDTITYSRDMVSPLSGEFIPDHVVMPGSVSEVQELLRVAESRRIPVYPYTHGTNAAGFALPFAGGMIVDLRRMNRILEIDEDTMTATIEPGVNWKRLDKEARKKGLRVTFPTGPYTGSPIASFLMWNITHYACRYGADRMVSLEAVLPNGEILRTGSAAFPGHERLNPYFRYAYGPDITGLYRGSFGAFGIVTKGVFELFPVGDVETHVDGGFEDLDSALQTMHRIEHMDISKYSNLFNAEFLVHCCAPDIEDLKSPQKIEEIGNSFPRWYLAVGLSGTAEQVDLYKEMVVEETERNGGRIMSLEGQIGDNLEDLVLGASRVINRMYEPHGAAASVISMVPLSQIPHLFQMGEDLIREFDIRHPYTGERLKPAGGCSPYDRGRNYYVELEFAFDPLDEESIMRVKKARNAWVKRAVTYGGSLPMITPVFAKWLMPSYYNILKGIKEFLDPDHLLSPNRVVPRSDPGRV